MTVRSGTRRRGLRPIPGSAQSRAWTTCARKWRACAACVRVTNHRFRALDLNQAKSVRRAKWCAAPDDLRACFVDEIDCRGPAYVGLDVGEAGSGTAACGFWPATGALRTWLAFGATPTLRDRAKRDGSDYVSMQRRGELRTYPGRTVPVKAFVADVRADLADAKVRGAYADSYRAAELRDCLPWALTVVRSGMGPDGSAAVRAFQRVVLTGALALRSNLSLATAIKESTLRRDANGNPAIDSARSRGRIDVLSAAVLAVGAGSKPRPSRGGIVRSAICEAVGMSRHHHRRAQARLGRASGRAPFARRGGGALVV